MLLIWLPLLLLYTTSTPTAAAAATQLLIRLLIWCYDAQLMITTIWYKSCYTNTTSNI